MKQGIILILFEWCAIFVAYNFIGLYIHEGELLIANFAIGLLLGYGFASGRRHYEDKTVREMGMTSLQ